MLKKISLTIDDGLHRDYQIFCAKRGYKISPRVALLIKGELEKIEDDQQN